ncbi:hypothetical protein V9T40_011130 [Parthenolecanium corni]|uniref:Uncharacterized protein n=1 Tax=Parthenolecanium corni TaxID=536013 RepID=A0AAN9T8D2_9HEMI
MQEQKPFCAENEDIPEQDTFGWDINPNLELQTTETGVEDVRKIFNCISNVHYARLPVQSPFLGIENR